MGHFQRVYNYVAYKLVCGASTIVGTTLLPGQMNFVLKAGDTLCVAGTTTNASWLGANSFPLNPGESINSDGAARLYLIAPGATATAYVLVSESQGFEGTT